MAHDTAAAAPGPMAARSANADTQVFELGVVEDAVLRALAARAGLLDAAERGDFGGNDPGIQAHDAVLERLRHAPRARQVARIKVGRQPELGIVRHADGVILALETEQRRDRAEGLLAR